MEVLTTVTMQRNCVACLVYPTAGHALARRSFEQMKPGSPRKYTCLLQSGALVAEGHPGKPVLVSTTSWLHALSFRSPRCGREFIFRVTLLRERPLLACVHAFTEFNSLVQAVPGSLYFHLHRFPWDTT